MKQENNKTQSIAKSPRKMTRKKESKNPLKNMNKIDSDMVAKGAAGVAIAAGVVAVGVALSKKENRRKIGHAAEKGMDTIGSVAMDLKEHAEKAYPQVQHEIAKLQPNQGQKNLKGRKTSRKHGR